jgi:DNA-binding FrmR family transcriptional regulator
MNVGRRLDGANAQLFSETETETGWPSSVADLPVGAGGITMTDRTCSQEQVSMNHEEPDVAACGCGVAQDSAHPTGGRKAIAVDPEIRGRNVRRLRRIEGQVRGLQRMVEEERYCADIMVQLAAVQEALRSVGRELMRNHLKHCATAAIRGGDEQTAEAMYDELIDLMYRNVR